MLQERVQGQILEQAWPLLSEDQKVTIADQVIEIRNQLRQITSKSIQSISRTVCYPGLLFSDKDPHGPFNSDTKLWDAIRLTLYNLPQQAIERFKQRLPNAEPYVLTHCGLALGNIMVQDGALAGILDWEFAAYDPIWYEYVSASWGWTEENAEWRSLQQEWFNVHGDGYEGAKSLWRDLRQLRKYPSLNDVEGRQALEELLFYEK